MDLFEHRGESYIIIVDYYSRYFEVLHLLSTTATTTIEAIKATFARHGVPEIVRADNGPQFACKEYANFAQQYGFLLITSSQRFPRSNGEAERAVRTAKALIKKNQDMYLGLLAHRSTPLQNGYSPAELLMGRRIRSTLVQHPSQLKAQTPPDIREKEEKQKLDMKVNHDLRHRARDLPPLVAGDPVVVRDTGESGRAIPAENAPRSYVVQTPRATIRRNRNALTKIPDSSPAKSDTHPTQDNHPTQDTHPPQDTITTKSGRAVKPPSKLDL
jgi:hypothetical protein